ncbi:unnamed protein product [Prorocentrum cordatum]|uniref:Uncharacterized protein n=1 Tax=Prorocentrum cordatum TaxID=2364126 RepID=A0ABN9VBP5_9DINO|nr:unnamed protein product [Polarella glacialis]
MRTAGEEGRSDETEEATQHKWSHHQGGTIPPGKGSTAALSTRRTRGTQRYQERITRSTQGPGLAADKWSCRRGRGGRGDGSGRGKASHLLPASSSAGRRPLAVHRGAPEGERETTRVPQAPRHMKEERHSSKPVG